MDLRGDRTLTLSYANPRDLPLAEDFEAVLEHMAYLWGFTVRLEERDAAGGVRVLGVKLGERRRRD